MKPKGRHDRYSAAEEAYFEKEKEGADQIEHAVQGLFKILDNNSGSEGEDEAHNGGAAAEQAFSPDPAGLRDSAYQFLGAVKVSLSTEGNDFELAN